LGSCKRDGQKQETGNLGERDSVIVIRPREIKKKGSVGCASILGRKKGIVYGSVLETRKRGSVENYELQPKGKGAKRGVSGTPTGVGGQWGNRQSRS